MAKINLPQEILEKETFKRLPAKDKEEYLSNLLKKILELNPEGATISQIKEFTGLTYSTIWHHLDILSCTAQGHKISRGSLDIYYPIGKESIVKEYPDAKGKALYVTSILKDNEGSFVRIHEKRQNRLGNYTVCSGIAIPIELVNEFIEALNKVKKSYLNEGKK